MDVAQICGIDMYENVLQGAGIAWGGMFWIIKYYVAGYLVAAHAHRIAAVILVMINISLQSHLLACFKSTRVIIYQHIIILRILNI